MGDTAASGAVEKLAQRQKLILKRLELALGAQTLAPGARLVPERSNRAAFHQPAAAAPQYSQTQDSQPSHHAAQLQAPRGTAEQAVTASLAERGCACMRITTRKLRARVTTFSQPCTHACRLRDFAFLRVQPGYYELSLEGRRAVLGAPSVEHLCKTLVLKNQRFRPVPGLAPGQNPEHFCVIIQASCVDLSACALLHGTGFTRMCCDCSMQHVWTKTSCARCCGGSARPARLA